MPKNDPEYERGFTDGFNAGANGVKATSDAEQLMQLREALLGVRNGLGCWCRTPFVNISEARPHEPRCLAARAALNPSHLQQETQ